MAAIEAKLKKDIQVLNNQANSEAREVLRSWSERNLETIKELEFVSLVHTKNGGLIELESKVIDYRNDTFHLQFVDPKREKFYPYIKSKHYRDMYNVFYAVHNNAPINP